MIFDQIEVVKVEVKADLTLLSRDSPRRRRGKTDTILPC